MRLKTLWMTCCLLFSGVLPAFASSAGSEGGQAEFVNLTGTALGIFALVLFVAAYTLVIFEEQLHLRKSKPVLLAAGLIWVLVALCLRGDGRHPHATRSDQAQPDRVCRAVPLPAGGDDLYQRHGRTQCLPGPALLAGQPRLHPAHGLLGDRPARRS